MLIERSRAITVESFFFFFISLEFLVLVPNFRAGRHLPYLWKKKSGEGKRYHPRRVMKDDALRQGRAEYTRSKTEVRGRAQTLGVTKKDDAITDVRDLGEPEGGNFKDFTFREFLPVESGSVKCQWNQRGPAPEVIK